MLYPFFVAGVAKTTYCTPVVAVLATNTQILCLPTSSIVAVEAKKRCCTPIVAVLAKTRCCTPIVVGLAKSNYCTPVVAVFG